MKNLLAIFITLSITGCAALSTTVSEKPATEPAPTVPKEAVEVVAENLDIPWDIKFLPSGQMLVTERPGRLLLIQEDTEAIEIQGVAHTGEGGLLGLEIDPDFESNQYIYLYLTTRDEGGLTNRVERYTLENNTLTNKEALLENIPGAIYHDGGRIEFGPDDLLYITTGDATVTSNAQDQESLAGKILRLDTATKEVEVVSYGHRNPQGLAWDDQGRLWAPEHGRSGLSSGYDELNLIQEGQNYGWPTIQGDETQEGMQTPAWHSGPRTTWAPAGAAYYDGAIIFAGLRGERLYRAEINEDGTIGSTQEYFTNKYGRLRAVELGPDSYIYFSTSNTDGRGSAADNDDRIIRFDPEQIFN